MTIAYICDNCDKVEKEKDNTRRVVIFERERREYNPDRHKKNSKLLCLNCLKLIGYTKEEKQRS